MKGFEIMKVLIFSDTHGRRSSMEDIISRHPDAQYVIHLGDCVADTKSITELFPSVTLLGVCGNCDFGSSAEPFGEVVLGGKRIFFTHGHKFSVKSGLSLIIAEGRRRNADAVLYGHTHIAQNIYDDGMYVFNPGSLSLPQYGRPSYGIMDIVNNQIALNIAEL